jgi:hypothetical protein
MHCRRLIFFFLLLATVLCLPAQTSASTTVTELPQWVKDLRRWEIIAFGSFPFAMLTVTTAVDIYRWSEVDFNDARYAPWPLKSAGAIPMKWQEQELTITLAASLSIAIAVADYIIVQVKRNKARKKAEILPAGSSIIIRTPLFPDEPDVLPEDSPPEDSPSDETSSSVP